MTVATVAPAPRLLMCPPQHFAVTYSINPWMDPAKWADDGTALQARAAQQWMALHGALLEAGAMVETVPPLEGAPDLVFTANAAVVLDGKALLARFRHPERQIEEPVFAAAFRALAERGLIDDSDRAAARHRAGGCGRLPVGPHAAACSGWAAASARTRRRRARSRRRSACPACRSV